MIKFEYKPNVIDTPFGALDDPPPVESVTMTLGGDVSWDEAVCEFHNFLRAAGYVIPYDFEDDYVDCSDPPDMDKSGSLGDRQPEWAMRMSGPDKWWNDESNTGVASEDEGNTDVAENKHIKSEQTHNTKSEVTYDPETGEPLIDKHQADLKIGAWLSAALEDPSTCQSMKDDINEWFECTPQVHRNTMHP